MITQTTLSETLPASPERRAALRGSGFVPSGANLETCLDAGSVAQALLPVRCGYAECEESPHIPTSHSAEILIANLELEFHPTHRKLSPLKISNRKFSPLLRLRFSSPSRSMFANESSDTRHASLCVLIHGSAIKSRRKPFTNNDLQISNRR